METVTSPPAGIRAEGLIHHAKVSIPPFTGVARPHLVARLDQGVRGRLTVLTAPAGWGKSTLVSEWAASTGLPVAGVALDPSVTTPERLLRYLVAALDRALPLRFDEVATMLRTAYPAVTDLAADAFIDRFGDLGSPVVIVLEDAHHLVTPETRHLLHRLVDEAPDTLRLVLTMRGEPRLPLARLRSAGGVTIIRESDLAFTAPEAQALLADASTPIAGDRLVQHLVERTEGWAAGLRLASLSLRDAPQPEAFLDRLRGTHRDFSDYFCEEVLDALDPALAAFLVETSILDSLSAPLALAVTGDDRGDQFAAAVASGLFLIPQDDARTWYRYHALFRDVLRTRFEALPTERRAAIHLRASAWYEEHCLIHDAVRQALAAGEPRRVTTLIEDHADTLMYECGDTAFLLDVFDELPRDLVTGSPGLLRVQAWALTTAGRIEQAERLLERGCDVCGENDSHLKAVRARLAAYRGDHRATVTFGKQALERLDVLTDGRLIADVTLSMGFAERAMGHIDAAADTFREAARLGRQHRNGQAARWGVRYLALARIAQGRLGEALAIVDEDLQRLDESGGDSGSHRAALLVTRAEILTEQNRLVEAREALDPAFGLIQRDGDAKMLMNAYVARARLAVAEGDLPTAREKARRAEEIFPVSAPRLWTTLIALAEGDLTTCERWIRLIGYDVSDDPSPDRGETEQLLFARIVASLGMPGAVDLLDRHVSAALHDGRTGDAIAFRASLAVALARAGRTSAAEEVLCAALVDASREGRVQVFLNEGSPMRALLRDLLRDRDALDDACRAFALDLIGRFPGASPVAEGATSVPGLSEPLTARQVEILRLLADGRSNREIAAELYIAEGTVKAHMHQLFGKLMARNRTEAVANARGLALIS